MSRKQFMVAIAAAITIPALVVSSSPVSEVQTADASVKAFKTFKDVPKTHQYYVSVMEMAKQGIVYGYTDGTFKPNEPISRKHAAALVNRAKGKSLPQTHKFVKFKDVNEKSPNFEDIKRLQMAGLFTPDAKGNFNPNKPLTRAEMAKILVVAFDLEVKADYDFPDVPKNHPANKYVRALYSNGITKGNDGKFLPNDSLTRGHYSAFMYRIMYLDKNFEAKPIQPGKPTTPPVTKPDPDTGKKYRDNGVVTDNYNRFDDVPKPSGYVEGTFEQQQEKKFNELRVKNVHSSIGAFTLFSDSSKRIIDYRAKDVGLSSGEFKEVINKAVKTGEVYDGGNFSLYYDFSTGSVNIAHGKWGD